MKQVLNFLHGYFIPTSYHEDEMVFRKVRILINTTLLTSLFALFFLLNTIFFDMPHAFILMVACAVLFALNAWLIKWGVNRDIVTHIYVGVATIGTFSNCYFSGGLYSFNVVWLALGPVCALLLSSARIGWIWLIISIIVLMILGVMHMQGYPFPFEMDMRFKDFMFMNSFLGLICIVFAVTLIMEKASVLSMSRLNEKNEIIALEKKRSDDLLLNILPVEIISELKETGQSKAKLFNHVSVLFTDFVNFTQISEQLNPEELVAEIDFCFKAFDDIMERNGLEKIKTIGDAYLAVCGLPNEDEQHAIKTVNAALEILNFVSKRLEAGGRFEIRIGIHSGSLVAGIVGVKKFAYDIWGDTVNTASRMQSSGDPGKINISESTFELVHDQFVCHSRGKIEAKNKGMIEMYFVDHTRIL
jgi:class 3 adenylate cyclase